MRVGLLNLDVGNIKSVFNVLKNKNKNIKLIETIQDYENQDIIFVSGVASFDNQIKKLKEKNFFDLIKNEKNKKIIGI